MKKKLEAELISIAHRILKLKNRAELEQLQQETLNLYQKLSVLKFVEDNFNDVKPTIGFASAEQKLEEIYSREPQTTAPEQQEPAEDKENTTPETHEENLAAEVAENVTPKEEQPEEIDTNGDEPVAEETPVATEEPAAVAEETQEPEEITQTETPEHPEETAESEPSEETAAEAEETTAETEEVQATETEPANVTEETVIDEPVTESDETATAETEETPAEDPQETEHEKEQEHHNQPEEHKKLAEQPVTHHREEITAEVGLHEDLQEPITEVPELPETGQLPEGNAEDTENGTGEGIDIPTGEPAVSQEEAAITEETTGTEINFDRKETKQREIVFEDFSKFIEPEFVKKSDTGSPKEPENAAPSFDDWMNWEPKKEEASPAAETPKEEPKPVNPLDDWMNWEPSKSTFGNETPSPQPKAEEPKAETKSDDWMNWEPSKSVYGSAPAEPEAPKTAPVNEWRAPEPESFTQKTTEPEPAKPVAPKYSDTFVRAMSLGLNDRIAFEKHLFGGSSEDLNRVVSQINTLNTYEEAHDFITDLVKPDYNNWNGKDEYEARFMELVEKKFR
ncbi:hypothetical protein ACLI08_02130 [Flavobacterium sp. RNTU_13]|uniref:hypothetical protein n=1 Tax=Flavobacterium sp. RNTU_13 TaxID=3375145 RepID=UPI0039877E33